MRSVLNLFKTDLIINWIYPIKTHGERLGASLGRAVTRSDNSGGGEYSYTCVLSDGFFLKSDCFYGM